MDIKVLELIFLMYVICIVCSVLLSLIFILVTFSDKCGAKLNCWLCASNFLVYFIYESLVPSEYNIRVDLLLIIPALGIILLSTLISCFIAYVRNYPQTGSGTPTNKMD